MAEQHGWQRGPETWTEDTVRNIDSTILDERVGDLGRAILLGHMRETGRGRARLAPRCSKIFVCDEEFPDTLSRVSDNLPDELPPNFEFGGYVIRECIGRGGMARVYRAEQAALHRPVALKVLDRWVLEKPQGGQRFLREARAAASVKHPNVVDIVDVGVWQERPYIVMELLSGSDLETHLSQGGSLSDSAVASLALPIIAGMMAVHDAGVIHRDLKPSNIFLSNGPDGEIIPKVLDFGVSKISDNLAEPMRGQTKTREIIGTPTYMAPEALNGARELGPRADQYALGAVLYECAVGRPPFEGETLLELLKAIAVGNVPPPRSIRPDISIALEDAILRAMNAEPSARFETLRDFGRAMWPLADERSRTIWARSFGSTRAGGASSDVGSLVLVRRDTAPEQPKATAPGWWSIRKLAWVAAFIVAGGAAAVFVLGSPLSDAESDGPHVVASTRDSLPVEHHSLRPDADRRAEAMGRPEPNTLAPSDGEEEAVLRPPLNPKPPSRMAQRMAKALSTGAAPRSKASPAAATAPRKRPVSPEAPAAGDDHDLAELFTTPELEGESANPDNNKELDGLFRPDDTLTLGANGAPLTD
jgi:serine/threonine-protein kinase